MSNVFANGMEVSAKKDANKSLAAMPDVCLSPPSPPAGPIPIPYPNFADASDTSDGSKTVKIGGSEVGLKNSSNYKTSKGDEAATKTLGMGVVTHTIQGKMKHAAWSFDVKIEGQNAIRHMDMTTHNHMNCPNSAAMTLNQAAMQNAQVRELTCDELDAANQEARANEMGPGDTPTTIDTAYREDGDGNGRYMKAMCPHNPLPECENGYQPPVAQQDQPACGGGRRPGYRVRNHAENKLLHPEMDAQAGGKIKISISHPAPNPPPAFDRAPCSSCRQSICEAEACGIRVELCRSGRPPETVRPQTAGLCPPDEGQGDYDPAWQNTGLGGF